MPFLHKSILLLAWAVLIILTPAQAQDIVNLEPTVPGDNFQTHIIGDNDIMIYHEPAGVTIWASNVQSPGNPSRVYIQGFEYDIANNPTPTFVPAFDWIYTPHSPGTCGFTAAQAISHFEIFALESVGQHVWAFGRFRIRNPEVGCLQVQDADMIIAWEIDPSSGQVLQIRTFAFGDHYQYDNITTTIDDNGQVLIACDLIPFLFSTPNPNVNDPYAPETWSGVGTLLMDRTGNEIWKKSFLNPLPTPFSQVVHSFKVSDLCFDPTNQVFGMVGVAIQEVFALFIDGGGNNLSPSTFHTYSQGFLPAEPIIGPNMMGNFYISTHSLGLGIAIGEVDLAGNLVRPVQDYTPPTGEFESYGSQLNYNPVTGRTELLGWMTSTNRSAIAEVSSPLPAQLDFKTHDERNDATEMPVCFVEKSRFSPKPDNYIILSHNNHASSGFQGIKLNDISTSCNGSVQEISIAIPTVVNQGALWALELTGSPIGCGPTFTECFSLVPTFYSGQLLDCSFQFSADFREALSPDSQPINIRTYYDANLQTLSVALPRDLQIQSLEVFNMSGQRLLSTQQPQLYISRLSAGVYLLKVNTNGRVFSEKIMVN